MPTTSDRIYYDVDTTDDKVAVEIIAGSFALSGATTAATVKGTNFAVTTVSSGTYTLTLNKVFSSAICTVATWQGNTVTDRYCSIGTISLANRTVQIRSWDKSGGAVTNIATDGTERINFFLVMGK